jgi:hypothetical protein
LRLLSALSFQEGKSSLGARAKVRLLKNVLKCP